jgi:hypothetical protein
MTDPSAAIGLDIGHPRHRHPRISQPTEPVHLEKSGEAKRIH